MPSDSNAFAYFQERIKSLAGINVTSAKEDLLRARLRRRLLALGLSDYESYEALLRSKPPRDQEWQAFVNELTTNKTDFFRESSHFDLLTELITQGRVGMAGKPINVWCAAASTGEEPYTIAMVLDDLKTRLGHDYKIFASDVDTNVLATAQRGVYKRARLEEIPANLQAKNFLVGTDGIDHWVRVKDSLKQHITFKPLNLIKESYDLRTKFDIIFCRNVFIYFTPETVSRVAEALYTTAAPGSYLFIGHTETLNGVQSSWTYIRPSVYQKRPA